MNFGGSICCRMLMLFKYLFLVELSTNLREVSQCQERAPTIGFHIFLIVSGHFQLSEWKRP